MVTHYDWPKLTQSELDTAWYSWDDFENSTVVNNECFSVKETVKHIFEHRKFVKQSNHKGVKIIESMLENSQVNKNLVSHNDKIKLCLDLLFAQYSIQLLDYDSIDLKNNQDIKRLYYILKSYGIPDDLFEEIFHIFLDYVQKKQSEK